MLHPCLLIAYRYLTASSGGRFARLTQVFAVSGMALGVGVLLVISSVFNGFHDALVKLYPTTIQYAHARPIVSDASWQDLKKSLSNNNVLAIYPLKTHYGAVFTDNTMQPVLLEGYDAQTRPDWYRLSDSDAAIIPVMIGGTLQSRLYLNDNERFNVTTATKESDSMRARNLRLSPKANIPTAYSQGLHALRIAMPMVRLNAALGEKKQSFTEVIIELKRSDGVRAALMNWNNTLDDWVFELEEDSSLSILSSLAVQKRLMLCVMSLVVVLAAFNLIAGLTIIVSERRKEIAVLQTLGFAKYEIVVIFLLQGLLLALLGIFLGLAFGLPVAYNTETIMATVEGWLGMKIIAGDVFFLGYLPSTVTMTDVVAIIGFTTVLALLFSAIPALYASRIQPAVCLRYDE